ncbi:Gfo/Idh/MocA family protein [Oceanobacillus polygoni]|uniref:Virulence factor n=1 Tax=Oceanobacillus polygoni TaxID=1235259 RepID=A0A9X1CE81_9BACI|nr:Gfo/Idh/MocA family oxidoreductase [Oceanobacillus polygoni]MBP2075942.1 virulence factor [Oceanobacillus polygoni]
MKQPRIAMIGLGGIAQKAYLPILTKETEWQFVGAFSPNAKKRKQICQQYRIQDFHSISALIQASDAVFVHSSTESHFELVSELLRNGKDVYVDKPLAATVEEAEKLVELGEKNRRKLMVGFNRRFAPMYVEAKRGAGEPAAIYVEKHRTNSIDPANYRFTMLDDYIHIVDLIRWFAGGELKLMYQKLKTNLAEQLVFAQHVFEADNGTSFNLSMHRKAGTNLEQLRLLTDGALIKVKNLNVMETDLDGKLTIQASPSWETILKQKGFVDAVEHFVECVTHDSQPLVDGVEGLKSQLVVEELLVKAES